MKEVESEWKFAQTRILAVDEASMASTVVIPLYKTRLCGDNIDTVAYLKRTAAIAVQTCKPLLYPFDPHQRRFHLFRPFNVGPYGGG